MRLFFAVTIPDEVLSRVTDLQDDLRGRLRDPGIRWTRREQFHYTARFIGEQPPLRAHAAVAAATAVGARTAPFRLTVGGVGAFPSADRPSVLWVGATDGATEFVTFAASLDAGLAAIRLPKQTKPAAAHLTLARVKSYTGEEMVAQALGRLTVGDLGSFAVDDFVLMQSVLRPTGSEYTIVERFRLGG